jgi:hypothetical protein
MEGRRATTTTNKRNPKYNLESSSSSSLSCKEDVEEGFIYVEKESNNLNTNTRNSNGTMLLNKRSKSVGDDFLEINGNEIVELEELEGRIEVNQQRDDYDDG